MSVFASLKERMINYACKRSPDSLLPGVKYETYHFRNQESMYADKITKVKPMNLLAYFKEGSNKYYVIMPNIYNDLTDAQVKELNDAVKDKQPPSIVFYGKDGIRNDMMIHQFNEGIDEEKLQEYRNKPEVPVKKAKLDDSATSSNHSTPEKP